MKLLDSTELFSHTLKHFRKETSYSIDLCSYDDVCNSAGTFLNIAAAEFEIVSTQGNNLLHRCLFRLNHCLTRVSKDTGVHKKAF